jgi:hypothetical protein
MAPDESQGFVNPLAALRVLEVSIDGVRELIAEMELRTGLRFSDLQSQVDQRFEQFADMSGERLSAVRESQGAIRREFEQRFSDSEKAIQAALTAADKAVQAALLAAKEAVAKAEVAAEKRFDAVNEFRGQLADQASSFMPRAEAEIRLSNMSDLIASNTNSINRGDGGAAAGQRVVGVVMAIAAIVVSLGAVIAVVVVH